MDMQAYSVLANVHKTDPTYELAATNARCGTCFSGHKADRYYRTNHLERLWQLTIPAKLLTTAAGLPRAAAALRRASRG